MAKKVVKLVKLQIPAGKASPAPPVGPALGQAMAIESDITARRNAEAALREYGERLEIATDAAGIGIWDYDPVSDALVWTSTVCCGSPMWR